MNVEQARFNMIEQQIRTWDVLDASVLALLAVVKREDFVPPAYRSMAFMDMEIPLPEGQAMLAPKLEARLLQHLAPARHEKVLEIGTGHGHMAALLAHKSLQVVSYEIRPALAAAARDNLRRGAAANVEVRTGDGAAGDPESAPFGAIMLSGSVAQVPQALLDQLSIGGRLIGIVGQEPVMRATLFTRVAERQWRSVELFDTVAMRLEGFVEPSRFRF